MGQGRTETGRPPAGSSWTRTQRTRLPTAAASRPPRGAPSASPRQTSTTRCGNIHSYPLLAEMKEGNVLFNDALNTFYLRLYGVRHMVKDDSDSERGNPLPPHRLLFPINSKGSFYMHHPTDRIIHTMAFVTPVVEHWLEREIAQWLHPMKDRSDDPSHHE